MKAVTQNFPRLFLAVLFTFLLNRFTSVPLLQLSFTEEITDNIVQITTKPDREEWRIQPWTEDNRYWQYKGEPIMLLGGSDQDNLFNHPNIGSAGLEAHLNLLVSVGGNYVRNTMSSRDRIDPDSDLYNDINRYPFYYDEEAGLYDLDRWDETYWELFKDFLRMTAELDIIVQIEVWDRWDMGEVWEGAYAAEAWSAHPYNPRNNMNYTEENTNLYEDHWERYPIFRTIPQLDDSPIVLSYQEAFVSRLLDLTFDYGHILYCISNESTAEEEWSRYWAHFIHQKADSAGVGISLTEMWNQHDLTHPMHLRTFNYPELFDYVDTSQNNHLNGQTHWDNMQAARQMVAEPPRPMNNNKIYGGEALGSGVIEGTNRFWRNILGGVSSSRFHRPGPSDGYIGIGLNELAQIQIRSAKLLLDEFNVFRAEPDADSSLLGNREENEAYLAYIFREKYAVYFPDGGSVNLDLSQYEGNLTINWLNIDETEWKERMDLVTDHSEINLTTPSAGQWIALVTLQ